MEPSLDSDSNKTKEIQSAFLQHKSVLVAYMSRFLLKSEDVEDILQETFLKTLEASKTKDIETPKSFLFIVARNIIFNRLKRKSKLVMTEISEVDERYLASRTVSADNKLHQKRKLQVFLKAADDLPPQCRRVFLMRKLLGKSQAEISSELGISKSTVERHITNALKRCQSIMMEKGYEVQRAPGAKSVMMFGQVEKNEQ